MKNPRIITRFLSVLAAFSLLLCACNTGIESTRTIKMSKSERRETLPSAEEQFVASLKSDELSSWREGKPFLVTDNKVSLLLELPAGIASDSLAGRILKFCGVEARPTPDGKQSAVIRFSADKDIVRYNTGRNPSELKGMTGLDVPMMIDLDMVAKADSLMSGKHLWIKSQLWYDEEGGKLQGRKFVPVTIKKVEAGDMVFPLRVVFSDEQNHIASIYMNVKAASGLGAESRTFPTLFFLSDPKASYPGITAEIWDYIQQGKVAIGMKKEECKLALGNPSDVNAGHNWNSLIDIWSYKDGTFLQFEDGILINYRH